MNEAKNPARILVVDDEGRNRRLLTAMLEADGYAATEAADGAQALELARQSPPDLVLLDIMMPVMDGYAVAQALKAHAATRAIPVIMVTALDDREARLHGLEAGAEEFVTKPVDRNELRIRVRNLLRLKEFSDVLQCSREQLQIANDKLNETNRGLEAFSYSASHDLRAPLRHISGYSAMLVHEMAGQLSAKAMHYLQEITGASRRMAQLIDDLLHFSRADRADMQRTRVDLNAVVEACIDELGMATGGAKITWKVSRLPGVTGDPAMLRQVFANLLGNAVKYSARRDAAVIEVGLGRTDEREVTFFVRDNGAGFDMKNAHRLFQAFQRLHSADQFEGTGIGLATARRVVERHGGRIWAEGAPDAGAVFYVSLPSASVQDKT